MADETLSIALEQRLAEAIRAAAEAEGLSVSEWLARLASAHLQQQRIRAQLEDMASPLEPQTEAEIHDLVALTKRKRASA